MGLLIRSIVILITFTSFFLSCNKGNQSKGEKEAIELIKPVSLVTSTFGVRGHCDMCKKTIEVAAKSVDGVVSANWDGKRKQIEVSFDSTKTNINAIHKAIAKSGFDTDKIEGDEEAYESLPECCRYDKEMDMSVEGTE